MADKWTIHEEPTPPALWVVYRGTQRVAQFESREAAEDYVSAKESNASA